MNDLPWWQQTWNGVNNLWGGRDYLPSISGQQDTGSVPVPGMGNDWDSMGTWGNALQGIGGIAQAWLGFNNLDFNKEKFNTSKDIWNAEREANRITTNTDIMDRQNARISSTGNNNAAGNYNSMNYTRSNSTIPKVTV